MNIICHNVYETDIRRVNVKHCLYFSVFTWLSLNFYIKRKKKHQSVGLACMYCIGVGSVLLFAYFQLNKSFLSDPKDHKILHTCTVLAKF